jgi:hypothetical protein
MSKYDIKELLKALDIAKKEGASDIQIEISSNNERLLLTYSEIMGANTVRITIFDSDTKKMAEITRTTRL